LGWTEIRRIEKRDTEPEDTFVGNPWQFERERRGERPTSLDRPGQKEMRRKTFKIARVLGTGPRTVMLRIKAIPQETRRLGRVHLSNLVRRLRWRIARIRAKKGRELDRVSWKEIWRY